jgi:hypothetical protein
MDVRLGTARASLWTKLADARLAGRAAAGRRPGMDPGEDDDEGG